MDDYDHIRRNSRINLAKILKSDGRPVTLFKRLMLVLKIILGIDPSP